jgi:hypothetical protein
MRTSALCNFALHARHLAGSIDASATATEKQASINGSCVPVQAVLARPWHTAHLALFTPLCALLFNCFSTVQRVGRRATRNSFKSSCMHPRSVHFTGSGVIPPSPELDMAATKSMSGSTQPLVTAPEAASPTEMPLIDGLPNDLARRCLARASRHAHATMQVCLLFPFCST